MKLAILFLLLAASVPAFAQTVFKKVLFLGNSITKHGPKADIDWSGNWGMAASAENKDYVHLVTKSLAERQSSSPEVMVKNIAEFERSYADYDFAAKQKEAVDFKADLIILAIGENVPALKTPDSAAKLQQSVTKILTALNAGQKPTILIRSCFWADAAKDSALEGACTTVSGIYVNIGALSKDKKNFARSERQFKHDGVANHPGDQGMKAIADALVNALPK